MKLPPALTWLQLFPRHTSVACPDGPAWLVELLQQRQCVGTTPSVLAVHDKTFAELGDLSRWEGLVALNCRGIASSDLKVAGFAHVRRFNVVPSLEQPRWLISLDSRRVASSSFSIYTPSRLSARAKRWGASLAARLGLPLWYRDTIIIASRQISPLEQALRRLFPDRDIRIALSAGAPEPAINRKAAGVVLALDGAILGFVKIAGTDVSRRIMEREAEIIPALASCDGVTAPTLLFAGDIDGRYVTVQSPLSGSPAPARLTAAHQRFLTLLRCGPEKPASLSNLVQALPGRIAALPVSGEKLSDSLASITPILERTSVPTTIVHGDFAPWNVRLDHGRISAFDWEYGELDGLPLMDETHFSIQVGREIGGWDIDRAGHYLTDCASLRPLGLDREQVLALHAVYLLDSIVRLLGEGYAADEEMVVWYQALLDRVVTRRPEAVLA